MLKLAAARAILRKLPEKQAGVMTPIAIGAGAAAGAHMIGKSIHKAREYKAHFQPGYSQHGETNE